MGSTNNIYSAAGGMMSQTHTQNRNQSPNQNTLEQLSNHSVSPNTEGQGLFNRMPYHQNQLIIGAGGQMQQTNAV